MNWINVKDRLPECEKEVLACTKSGIMTTAIYEDGMVSSENSSKAWCVTGFIYNTEKDAYYVSKGWWEQHHFDCGDMSHGYIDEKVVCWQPLPEPPRSE